MTKILMRRRHQQGVRPTPHLPEFMGWNGAHMDNVQSGLGQGQEVLQIHLIFCRTHELHPQVLAFQVDVLQGLKCEVEVLFLLNPAHHDPSQPLTRADWRDVGVKQRNVHGCVHVRSGQVSEDFCPFHLGAGVPADASEKAKQA
ncbi:MAG: hypothetical protein VX446_08930, partial [Bacteroidota bacterium]|nr:hypothetical protein [Bacteroidota bacterium]